MKASAKQLCTYQRRAPISSPLILLVLFSPYASAAFSEKFGYFSLGGVFLFFALVFAAGGLQALIDRFRPTRELTEFEHHFFFLASQAEALHREITTKEEILDNWVGQHVVHRTQFLLRLIGPLVEQDIISGRQAIRRDDLVLITLFYDLIYSNGGNVELSKRERKDKATIKKYLEQQPDPELKEFTFRKLIQSCFLNQTIGDPKADRLWADICEQYAGRGMSAVQV